MNQQEAIGYIQDILPQISHSSEAEDVLLKFAHAKNLAPAQVERLGQVFNNAKTLTFLEKSANRGGSFPVIDTENLVARYTDLPTKRSIQQPGRSAEVSEWCGDDLSKSASEYEELSSFPSLEALQSSEPRFVGEPDACTSKEASELEERIQFFRKHAAHACMRIDEEFLDMFEDEQRDIIRDKVASIVDSGRSSTLDFKSAIKAAAYLLGPETYGEVQGILKSASNGRLNAVDMDFKQLDEEYAFNPEARQTEEVVDLHDKLASILHSYDLLRIAREERESIIGEKSAAVATGYGDTAQQSKAKMHYNQSTHSPQSSSKTTKSNPKGKPRGTPSSRGNGGNGGGGNGGDDKDKKDKKDNKKNTADEILESLVGVMNPSNVNSKVKELINDFKSPNKSQYAVDTALSDSAAHVALTKALRDPIVSEADPETVVSLFNSMRAANPAFVEDPNNLVMALREAVQYDSIPIHTLKELLDMSLSQAKIKDLNDKAYQSNYGNVPRKA